METNWRDFENLMLNGKIYSRSALLELASKKMPNCAVWEKTIFQFLLDWFNGQDEILVNTSGSTGNPKTIRLWKNAMVASAQATNSFFSLNAHSSALLCLSADYIAGKMMIVRALVGGFDLHCIEAKSDALCHLKQTFDFTAIVPMQLETALKQTESTYWKQIKKIIVGGAAVPEKLLPMLEGLKTEFWSTYGMTETITHIALRRLNGDDKTDYFQALENVSFSVDERGCLRIAAKRLNNEAIQTNDNVELISAKQFRFIGRADFIINSGGLKLSPERIEQKMTPFIKEDFAFSSMPDELLGEKLVLLIESEVYANDKYKTLEYLLDRELERFQQPKEIRFIEELPRNSNGKLDRLKLKKFLKNH